MRRICSLLLLIILFSCAKQGFPPGGPVDKRPPRIIRTVPPSDSTNIARDSRIEIEFSEPIDRRSCEESVYITPYPGENVKYRWKKRKLLIEFSKGLLEDRTYVITIGTGTKDLRNNALLESFSFAFSTGENIDPGSVSGYVDSPPGTAGAELWAYDLADNPQPNPSVEPPVYVTQIGRDGSFQFSYLALSSYRIFAVLDRDKNGLYERQFDMIGVTSKDAILDADRVSIAGLNFQIALEDTVPPVIADVTTPDNQHLLIRFSEILRHEKLSNRDNYTITSATDSLSILDVYQDQRNGAYVHLTTQKQQGSEKYSLKVKHAVDMSGNIMAPDSGRFVFTGSAVADRNKPRFLFMVPPDSSILAPLNSKIVLHFSESMDRASFATRLGVTDTLGKMVEGRVQWPDGSQLVFIPNEPLEEETDYLVKLPVDSVYDVAGNPLEDSLFIKRFKTVDRDTLSEISGRITDLDTTASGPFYVKATAGGNLAYEDFFDRGEYFFKNILPGRYTLYIYRDEDQNGEYSGGTFFPFQPAERFIFYPDTIEVRSRWPNEGNDIIFPE